jgi:uncharacterized membrane protein (UPF0127 family)
MRFALDLVWLDAHGETVRIDRSVPPRRMRLCRAARSVVEYPSYCNSRVAANATSPPGPRTSAM